MKKFAVITCLTGIFLGGMTPQVEANLFGNDCCNANSCCDGKFVVGAEWLYWRVEEDNLNAGLIQDVVDDPIIDDYTSVTHKFNSNIEPKFNWDSGYRLYAGYEFCDCWELDVIYTYLPSSASTTRYENIDTSLTGQGIFINGEQYPILNGGIIDSNKISHLNSYHAKWSINTNCIDVDLTKTVCFGECLRLRPHVGFRAFWFDQKYRVDASFVQPVNRAGPSEQSRFINGDLKQTFNGYGVEGGLWADYEIGCGLSIVGHIGGAILYSKSTVKQYVETILSTDLTTNDYHSTSKIGTPMLDTFLGLQYADCICDMMFFGRVGWEQHVAFDVNRLATGHGNISGQGLTLGLGVGF